MINGIARPTSTGEALAWIEEPARSGSLFSVSTQFLQGCAQDETRATRYVGRKSFIIGSIFVTAEQKGQPGWQVMTAGIYNSSTRLTDAWAAKHKKRAGVARAASILPGPLENFRVHVLTHFASLRTPQLLPNPPWGHHPAGFAWLPLVS